MDRTTLLSVHYGRPPIRDNSQETDRETYGEIKPTAHHSVCDEGAFIFIWKLRRQSILILSMANHFPITRVQLDEWGDMKSEGV